MTVDETWRNNVTIGVDSPFSLLVQFTDRSDQTILDRNISLNARRAGTVYYESVLN